MYLPVLFSLICLKSLKYKIITAGKRWINSVQQGTGTIAIFGSRKFLQCNFGLKYLLTLMFSGVHTRVIILEIDVVLIKMKTIYILITPNDSKPTKDNAYSAVIMKHIVQKVLCIYTHVSKTVHFCFCQNFVKFPLILISFGRYIAKWLKMTYIFHLS